LRKGLRRGRSVYKQPETEVDGSCHSKEGSKYAEGIGKGNKGSKENQQGEIIKQGECAMYIQSVSVYINECLW
jgi:hypothetical protein